MPCYPERRKLDTANPPPWQPDRGLPDYCGGNLLDGGSMKVKPIFFLYQSGSLPETAAMEGYLKDLKEKFRDEFFWIFGINLYPGPTLLTLSQVSAIRGYLRIGHTFLIQD